jgi:serine/threonine protein kinase
MSRITTTCSHCQKKLRIDERFLDKTIRCPKCESVFKVESVGFATPSDPVASQEALVTYSKPDETPTDPPNLFEQIEVSQESLNSRQSNYSHSPAIKSIGRYEVEMELGRGAFGTVFEAHDPVLKRNVAIKLPHDSLKADEYEKVLQEARAAARLRHPNIVSVFEVDSDGGRPFVVTELIDGQTLADRIAVGPIEPNDAATMARDLALGLAYSHSEGLVHRDIKPQNVLIGKDGRPQIADFGLAVDRRDESEAREQAYSRSGTLAYMAPEQAGIGGASVGPAADQYALGATFFEMLTGKRPHVGSSIEILTELEKPAPPQARNIRPAIPLDLDAICAKAMAHEPWKRYEDCTELAEDLNRYLRGELIRGRKIGLVERARYFSKKNPRLAAWTTAGAVIAGSILLFSTYSIVRTVIQYRYLAGESTTRESQANGSLAKSGSQTNTDDSTLELTSIADGNAKADGPSWLAYSRKLNKASRSIAIGEYEDAHQFLEQTNPQLRNWEFSHLGDLSSRHITEWQIDVGTSRIFPLHDGNRVALLVGQDEIQFRSISKGTIDSTWKIPWLSPPNGQVHLLESQPIFAFMDGAKLRFWNYEEQSELPSLDVDLGNQQIKSIEFSPDGQWFAVACFDDTIRIWDLPEKRLITTKPLRGQKIVFPPDSKCAFIEAYEPQLLRVTLPDLQEGMCSWFLNNNDNINNRESLVGVSKNLSQVIALQDQQTLVCGGLILAEKISSTWIWSEPDANNRLVATASGNVITFFRNGKASPLPIQRDQTVRSMAMSNNGKLLFAASVFQTTATLRIWDTESVSPCSEYGMTYSNAKLANSADGKEIASDAGGRINIFETESLKRRTSSNFDSEVSSLAYHPGGKILASGHENGTVRVWNSLDGTEMKTFPSLGSAIGKLAYSKDGEMLAVGLKRKQGSNPRSIDVIVFSASNGLEIQRYTKHKDSINSIDFDASGKRLVTSDDDGNVLLWSTESSEPLASQYMPTEFTRAAAFDTDNKSILMIATPYRNETRTQIYSITTYAAETRTRQIVKTNYETRSRTDTRKVDFEGKVVAESYETIYMVPSMLTEEVAYTVQVPVAVTKTEDYSVVVQKPQSNSSASRPRLIRLSASNLKIQSQWIPEADRIPQSFAFSADRTRLFVSTNGGISVLHPDYLFELVELKTGLTNDNLDHLFVGAASRSLHAFDKGKLITLKDIPVLNEQSWESIANSIREYPATSKLAIESASAPGGKPNPNLLTQRTLKSYQPPVDNSPKSLSQMANTVASIRVAQIAIDRSKAGLSFGTIKELQRDKPIKLDGLIFDDGLFAHAESRYKVALTPEWTTFSTRFGLHDRGNGSVVFAILGDGKPLYRSSIIRDHRIHGINLDVRDIKELELVVLPADHGNQGDFGVWLEPTLFRKPLPEVNSALAGAISLSGENIKLAKLKLSDKGMETIQVKGDPILRINGIEWRPADTKLLPNEGNTKFFSEDVDYLRSKLDLFEAGTDGDIDYSFGTDAMEITLRSKSDSSFKAEVSISMPRKERILEELETNPKWATSWKVAGYALEPNEKNTPPNESLPPKGIKPFAVKEFDAIDWSWWDTDCPLSGAPKDHFVVVGERKLNSDGGIYRIETLADDGIRVKVDGVTVIDNWQNQCITQFARLLTLAPGEHKVRFEYFEGTMVSRLSINLRCIEPATTASNR